MAWLTSLPGGVVISEEKYYETRQDPNDDTKQQIRDRRVTTTEYRGLDYNAASTALTGYPQISGGGKVSRSLSAIGGGGYNVIEIQDVPTGTWENDTTF